MVCISVEKRVRIYGLAQEGFPSRYIAKKENVSQSSVVRICNKAEETGTRIKRLSVGIANSDELWEVIQKV
ncbi:2287_t:CDS:2 [Scutellospora calospora]|uniref:2287_t:CDS:1 n=1 Tax=Scutellospora calospora TaxID=85575 RepID=A0ACA9JZ51_9GLOM|nr:2287_t:CDS:2 [Scutellospora calospora]